MLPGRIRDFTRDLFAPPGWNVERDGPCASLAIRDERHNTRNFMVSAWYPTPDEIVDLVAGAPIYLHVAGVEHPPVGLEVGLAPDVADAQDAEFQATPIDHRR